MIINMIQKSCIDLFLINLFGQLLDVLPKNFIFKKFLIQSFHLLKHGLLVKILNR